jgi:uncharacterized protein
MKHLPEALEQSIRKRAKFYLSKGRPGDWEHTLRALKYGRILINGEGGDPFFVIPALYLHDIGWSQIDYNEWIIMPAQEQEKSQAALLHQERGADLAEKILKDLDYDLRLTTKISDYIRVHDQPERILSLDCLQAILCFEADRLDRFGEGGKRRLHAIFNGFRSEERADFLRRGARRWFKTKTALSLLESLT